MGVETVKGTELFEKYQWEATDKNGLKELYVNKPTFVGGYWSIDYYDNGHIKFDEVDRPDDPSKTLRKIVW